MPSSPGVLARVLATTNAVLTIGGITILLLTLDQPPQGGWGFRGFPAIFALIAGIVGWLIMTRRPENRIGLIVAVIGVLNAAQLFLTEFGWLGTRIDLPGSGLAAWMSSFVWVPTVALMAGAIPLLFPDGHLPSPRWRIVGWTLALAAAAEVAILAVYPSALDTPRPAPRYFHLPISDETMNAASYAVLFVVSAGVLGAAASLVRRWREARDMVRQQLKWLVLALVAVVATMWLAVVPNPVANAVFIAAIGSVLIAIGIAILRYGLYDIDAVVNRTLVFGALTAILTGAFAALLKLFQALFVAVTGNESDAAAVITTLILATSFVPLKKWLEGVVERRFGTHLAGPVPDTPAPSGDLESLLRRVVREEVRAALSEPDARSTET